MSKNDEKPTQDDVMKAGPSSGTSEHRLFALCATEELRRDLAAVLNKHGVDDAADIPDTVLAAFLANVLFAAGLQMHMRDQWFGFDPRKSFKPEADTPAPDPVESLRKNPAISDQPKLDPLY